jgi:streptogramin lyase
MGIHTGEAAQAGDRYLGLAVHRAARICAAAHGGQIVASETTTALVHADEEQAAGVGLRSLGEHPLKDFDRPVMLYQVVADGLADNFPPLRTTPAGETPFAGREDELAGRARWRFARGRRLMAVAAGVALALVGAAGFVAYAAAHDSHDGERQGAATEPPNTLLKLNPQSGEVLDTVRVGKRPDGLVVSDGYVWTVNADDATLSRVDARTLDVRTFGGGTSPSLVAAGEKVVWLVTSDGRSLVRVATEDGHVLKRIRLPSPAGGLAVGARSLWVTLPEDAPGATVTEPTLLRIDPRSGRVTKRFATGSVPLGVAVGPDAVWVSNYRSGTVTTVSRLTGLSKDVEVCPSPVGVATGAGSAWVACYGDQQVWRLDGATGRTQAVIPVGDGVENLTVAGDSVWAPAGTARKLYRIDARTNKVDLTIPVRGSHPQSAAVGNDAVWLSLTEGD